MNDHLSRSEKGSSSGSNRLLFIDVARSLAIVLVLVMHAVNAFGGIQMMGVENELKVRLFTRNIPGLFIFMFGMMLELVYRRKWEAVGAAQPSRRLVVRSFQCFVGYQVTVLAGLIAGLASPKLSLKASLFLASAEFGNILRFYAFALLLAIPLLALRVKFGKAVLVALLVGIWGTYPWIESLEWSRSSMLSFPLGVLFGPMGHLVGPSVLQGMTFVLVGMLCASGLSNWREEGLARFRRITATVALIAGGIVLYLILQSSAGEVFRSFAGIEWRRLNHPGWYSIGLMNCSLALIALSYLFPPGTKASPWLAPLLTFGRSSLMAFTAGNVMLIFLKGRVVPTSALSTAMAVALFFVVLWLVLRVKEQTWDRRRALSG